MKTLLINGSAHSDGCTFTALNEVAKTLNENDIETEMLQIGNQEFRGCFGCGHCFTIKKCVLDDLVNEIAAKMPEYDGIVIGSPVYYAAPNGTLLAFLDRLFYSSFCHDKTMKVGAAVVAARRSGCTAAYDVLNKYFTLTGMPVVSSQYWNNIHGNNALEAVQDIEGLQTMRVLGRNMAFLMKSITLGKDTYGLPAREKRIFTNFIKKNSE
jgi:multimeric flavodoxin WrbA